MKWPRKYKREIGRPAAGAGDTAPYQSDTHHHRFRVCGRKRRFSKRQALEQINIFNRKRRGRHGNAEALTAYACPFCPHWHLTKEIPC